MYAYSRDIIWSFQLLTDPKEKPLYSDITFGFFTVPLSQIQVEIYDMNDRKMPRNFYDLRGTVEEQRVLLSDLLKTLKPVKVATLTGDYAIHTMLEENQFMVLSTPSSKYRFFGHEQLFLTWHHQVACQTAVFHSVAHVMGEDEHIDPPSNVSPQIAIDTEEMKGMTLSTEQQVLRQWLPNSLCREINSKDVPATIIQGTAGIGKSVKLAYCILLEKSLLSRLKPTNNQHASLSHDIIYHGNSGHRKLSIAQNTVYCLNQFDETYLTPNNVYVFDAVTTSGAPLPQPVAYTAPLIMAASLNPLHTFDLDNTQGDYITPNVNFLNVPSFTVRQACSILPMMDSTKTLDPLMMAYFGGIPRTLLRKKGSHESLDSKQLPFHSIQSMINSVVAAKHEVVNKLQTLSRRSDIPIQASHKDILYHIQCDESQYPIDNQSEETAYDVPLQNDDDSQQTSTQPTSTNITLAFDLMKAQPNVSNDALHTLNEKNEPQQTPNATSGSTSGQTTTLAMNAALDQQPIISTVSDLGQQRKIFRAKFREWMFDFYKATPATRHMAQIVSGMIAEFETRDLNGRITTLRNSSLEDDIIFEAYSRIMISDNRTVSYSIPSSKVNAFVNDNSTMRFVEVEDDMQLKKSLEVAERVTYLTFEAGSNTHLTYLTLQELVHLLRGLTSPTRINLMNHFPMFDHCYFDGGNNYYFFQATVSASSEKAKHTKPHENVHKQLVYYLSHIAYYVLYDTDSAVNIKPYHEQVGYKGPDNGCFMFASSPHLRNAKRLTYIVCAPFEHSNTYKAAPFMGLDNVATLKKIGYAPFFPKQSKDN